MIKKLLFVAYYALISHLPHSRYVGFFSRFRSFYVHRLLGVTKGGELATFENGVYISGPGKVQIGSNCQINERVFIQAAIIGDNVMIAPNVALISNSKRPGPLGEPMVQAHIDKGLKVILEDDVWIGRNAIVMPGVTVGAGSIVGAGAVVTRDVEPGWVVGGVPARPLKKR